jgi:hypothetical protein
MAILRIEMPEVDGLTPADLAQLVKDLIESGIADKNGESIYFGMGQVTVSAQDPATDDEVEEARNLYGSDEVEI